MPESDSESPDDRDALEEQCSRLRRAIFRSTDRLTAVKASRYKRTVRTILCDLAEALDATAVHLFRIGVQTDGEMSVAIQFASEQMPQHQADTLARFHFKILSQQIQQCLQSDSVVSVEHDSNAAGRIITGLIKQSRCEAYVICPIHQRGKLRGFLGIARRNNRESLHRTTVELIRLNGAVLFSHIFRIAKEKRRNAKLRQWREIANQACDFAVSIDRRLQIIRTTPFGNQAMNHLLDGLRLIDIVARNFHRELREQIRTAVDQGQPRTSDLQLSQGHEKPHWYLVRVEPGDDVSSTFATLYFTDNNPDKILEEEVRELNESLTKAARLSLLGQMSTEFSHQLNQPLQAILTYCNTVQRRLLKGTNTAENTTKALENIEASVTHAAEIIQRIRDFVRFRSLRQEEIPLSELINHAMMMVVPTARGRNADLEAPPEIPDLVVNVDRPQTAQVLVNLMVNAVEACCQSGLERPRIEIYAREDAPREAALVCVKDNGPGLPEDPSVVFRKFYSSKDEGLGMGLAISRDICESQGGGLRAFNNSPGPGCTFVARLPLVGATGHDTDELVVIPETDPED